MLVGRQAALGPHRFGGSPFSKTHVMTAIDCPQNPVVVLVVEDETLLRMSAVCMVEDAGYVAIEAADAKAAVEVLESRSDVALLLTDVQMPGPMDGIGLVHAVQERWPPIKIIVVSGGVKQVGVDITAACRFFGKPLREEEVVAEMRDLLKHAYGREPAA